MKAKRRLKGDGTQFAVPDYQRDKNGFVLDDNGNKIVAGYRLKGTRHVDYKGKKAVVNASVKDDGFDAKTMSASRAGIKALESRLAAAAAEWTTCCAMDFAQEHRFEIDLARHEEKQSSLDASADADRLRREQSLNFAIFKYLNSQGVRAGNETKRGYRSNWLNRIAHDIGLLPLQELDEETFVGFQRRLADEVDCSDRLNVDDDSWMLDWVETGKMPSSRSVVLKKTTPKGAKNIVNFIKAVVKFARRNQPWKSLNNQFNEILDCPMFRKVVQASRDWDPLMLPEFRKLCAAAESMGLVEYIPFMTLVRHGFRPAEARAVRWTDVDLNTKRISVSATLRPSGGEHLVEGEAKTEAALDWVNIEDQAFELITKYGGKGDFVVGSAGRTTSKDFMPRDVYIELWQRIRAEAELDSRYKPYHLKHGMVTELVLANVPEATIIFMTRHTSVETIRKAYTWIGKGEIQEHMKGRFSMADPEIEEEW